MKSLILWVAFMMLVVKLLHVVFSAVQLTLQEANIPVYVCEYCAVFSNMLQIKLQVIVLRMSF